jgi:hypothetical protein
MTFGEVMYGIKQTAKDAFYAYFAPLKVIVAFFGVFGEMFRQFFICMAMNSDDYKKIQEFKLEEETVELSKAGLSTEDVEKEL